jgi:excinuclease UvrABC nuclease subunit
MILRFPDYTFPGFPDEIAIKQELNIPSRFSGVYAFIEGRFIWQNTSIYDRVLYVGKAKDIRNRILKHLIYNPYVINKMIDDDVACFEIYAWRFDKPELLERNLIETLKPKYNVCFT